MRRRHDTRLALRLHIAIDVFPRRHHPRFIHGIQRDVHVRQHVLDRLGEVQPDLGPEPLAAGGGGVISNIDGHLVIPRLLPHGGGREAPEGAQVMVDLVEEILDHDGAIVLRKLEPDVETGRGVASSPLAVDGGGGLEVVTLLLQQVVEGLLGGFDQGVDGVRRCFGFGHGRLLLLHGGFLDSGGWLSSGWHIHDDWFIDLLDRRFDDWRRRVNGGRRLGYGVFWGRRRTFEGRVRLGIDIDPEGRSQAGVLGAVAEVEEDGEEGEGEQAVAHHTGGPAWRTRIGHEDGRRYLHGRREGARGRASFDGSIRARGLRGLRGVCCCCCCC